MGVSALPKHSVNRGPKRRGAMIILIALVVLAGLSVTLLVDQVRNQESVSDNSQTGSRAAPGQRSFSASPSSSDAGSEATVEPTDAANAEQDPAAVDPVGEDDPAHQPAVADDEAPELSISGAVLDDRGILLPGIDVLATPVNDGMQESAETPAVIGGASQRTDELGSFLFENIEDGEYELAVAASAQYRPAIKRVRAGASNAELILQRIRSVRVFGQVVSDVGDPLAEVQVRLLGTSTRAKSDADGQYEILVETLKAGQAPVLDFHLSGFEDARQRVEAMVATDLEETRLDVQMQEESSGPKVTLSGQVYGPQGEPVNGARLQLSSPSSRTFERASSNEAGDYVFSNIEVGDDYRVSVDPPEEYAAFESDALPVGPDGYYYQIVLESAAHADLSGIVTDLNGKQLAGFTLWLHALGDARSTMQLRTDSAGKFEVQNIPAGAIKFESQSQPWLRVSGIELKTGDSRYITVPVDWGQSWLFGRVLDDSATPVAGARVVLQSMQHHSGVNTESRREVMSDLEGYFTVSNLGAPDYTLTIQAPGYRSSRVQHRLDQDNELRITLPRLDSTAQSGASGG
jgi:hypothetical protein